MSQNSLWQHKNISDETIPDVVNHFHMFPTIFLWMWASSTAITILAIILCSKHVFEILHVSLVIRREKQLVFLPPMADVYIKIFIFFPLIAFITWFSLFFPRSSLMLQLVLQLYEVGCLLWFWELMTEYLSGPETAFKLLHLATSIPPNVALEILETTSKTPSPSTCRDTPSTRAHIVESFSMERASSPSRGLTYVPKSLSGKYIKDIVKFPGKKRGNSVQTSYASNEKREQRKEKLFLDQWRGSANCRNVSPPKQLEHCFLLYAYLHDEAPNSSIKWFNLRNSLNCQTGPLKNTPSNDSRHILTKSTLEHCSDSTSLCVTIEDNHFIIILSVFHCTTPPFPPQVEKGGTKIDEISNEEPIRSTMKELNGGLSLEALGKEFNPTLNFSKIKLDLFVELINAELSKHAKDTTHNVDLCSVGTMVEDQNLSTSTNNDEFSQESFLLSDYLSTVKLGPYAILGIFPFCFLSSFLTKRSFNKMDFQMSYGLVAQYFIFALLATLSRSVSQNVMLYFEILSFVSLYIAMYGLLILFLAIRRIIPRNECKLEAKLTCIKLGVFVIKGTDSLFRYTSLVRGYNDPYGKTTMRYAWTSFVINVAIFPVILLSIYSFSPKDITRRHSTLHEDRLNFFIKLSSNL